MTDWSQTLERECDNARASLNALSRRFALTSATLLGILSALVTFADSRGITFDTAVQFAPWWVSVQLISMGVFLLYGSYQTEIGPALRQVAGNGQKPPLTPVRLLQSATYLLMFVGCVSVFFVKHSNLVYVMFGVSAALSLVSGWIVLKGVKLGRVTREVLGPSSRSKDALKRLEHDITRMVIFMLTTAVVYLVFGGLLAGLVWDGALWTTALPLSILVSIFIGVTEKSFNQYEAIQVRRLELHSLDQLRLESLTNDGFNDARIRNTLRTIKGLPALDASKDEGLPTEAG